MLIELRDLKPNPFRDFTVDPIDPETVESLKESIAEDGFWGGVICRKVDGHVEIAAGHHRTEAAIQAGLNVAELYVADLDDAAMIRIYARENATQRGNSGTAMAGSVASAIRFLAKAVLTGNSRFLELGDLDAERRHLTSDRGLGEPLILQFLPRVPGITIYTVRQQLANLKASGDYGRIIGEVKAEIEREEREAAEALARAEEERRAAEAAAKKAREEREAAEAREREAQAAADRTRAEHERQQAEVRAQLAERRRREAEEEARRLGINRDRSREASQTARQAAASKAASRERTFDFEGVAKHLKNANQIAVFRDVATGKGVAPYLPVDQQAALAAQLVATARDQGKEISGTFIRENTMALALSARSTVRQMDEAEKRAAQETDLRLRFQQCEHDFLRNLHGLNHAGRRMLELMKENPKYNFQFSPSFKETLSSAKNVIDPLYERTKVIGG